jgi:hypothetical protein
VDSLLTNLVRKAATSADPVWRDIMPAAACGLVAHARGRHADAARLLGSILPRLPEVGGSSTQHHLFRMVHLASLAGSAPGAPQHGLAFRMRERAAEAWSRLLDARPRLAA